MTTRYINLTEITITAAMSWTVILLMTNPGTVMRAAAAVGSMIGWVAASGFLVLALSSAASGPGRARHRHRGDR